ncbi:hypothetical protein C480_07152 [Natrialba aegyptia DSM 13077]|uniref:Uncharacterized protein n=1 Tax=Natrialba aegyptia DSM 13077 TaxID=1227491 RepID=M0B7J4_9EURY|nr:hypothetical protein C480_07152 [Natrialba aegyptia DSM 13077]
MQSIFLIGSQEVNSRTDCYCIIGNWTSGQYEFALLKLTVLVKEISDVRCMGFLNISRRNCAAGFRWILAVVLCQCLRFALSGSVIGSALYF